MTTMRGATAALVVMIAALLACKQEDQNSSAEPAAGKATTTAAANTAAPPAAASGSEDTEKKAAPQVFVNAPPKQKGVSDIPAIPTTNSDPPKGKEWDQGVEVNTQAANSRPADCVMHVLREWLSIYCSGDVTGFEKMENFGREGFDYYMSIRKGKHAHIVLRMKKGRSQKIRICRKDNRASLFVSWPSGSGQPRHVALGKGPACDGSDWGAFLKKKGTSNAASDDRPMCAADECQSGFTYPVIDGATTCEKGYEYRKNGCGGMDGNEEVHWDCCICGCRLF